jgi:hypothetical protein
MECHTQTVYRPPVFESETSQADIEAAPATQRWLIEEALRMRRHTKAEQGLADWAYKFTEASRQGQPLHDFADFQITLHTFLDNSRNKPTDTFTTIRLCNLLEDKDLRARYLYRMLGEPELGELRARPESLDYWRPAPNELGWLVAQRAELEEYPVVEAIDRVLAHATAQRTFAEQYDPEIAYAGLARVVDVPFSATTA